jgi:hypothetical protein
MHGPDFLAFAGVLVAGTAIVRPIAKGFAARLAGGGRADDARIRQLEAELQQSRQQLLETREQVQRMSEQVGFLENLLGQPAGMGELPPARR